MSEFTKLALEAIKNVDYDTLSLLCEDAPEEIQDSKIFQDCDYLTSLIASLWHETERLSEVAYAPIDPKAHMEKMTSDLFALFGKPQEMMLTARKNSTDYMKRVLGESEALPSKDVEAIAQLILKSLTLPSVSFQKRSVSQRVEVLPDRKQLILDCKALESKSLPFLSYRAACLDVKSDIMYVKDKLKYCRQIAEALLDESDFARIGSVNTRICIQALLDNPNDEKCKYCVSVDPIDQIKKLAAPLRNLCKCPDEFDASVQDVLNEVGVHLSDDPYFSCWELVGKALGRHLSPSANPTSQHASRVRANFKKIIKEQLKVFKLEAPRFACPDEADESDKSDNKSDERLELQFLAAQRLIIMDVFFNPTCEQLDLIVDLAVSDLPALEFHKRLTDLTAYFTFIKVTRFR